jgi:hypothetical protein
MCDSDVKSDPDSTKEERTKRELPILLQKPSEKVPE